MDILPLKVLTKEDWDLFSDQIICLGILSRHSLPVLPGLAIHIDPAGFKQSKNTPLPKNLEKELGKSKHFFYQGKFLSGKDKLWKQLQKSWSDEITSKTQRLEPINKLSSQVVCWSEKKGVEIQAYFDPHFKEVVIKSEKKVDPKALQLIDKLVVSANKILVLHHHYTFLITEDKKIYLTGVAPFTHQYTTETKEQVIISKQEKDLLIRPVLKIFAGTSNRLAAVEETDGVVFESAKFPDTHEAVKKLLETAQSMGERKVIFKLPNIQSKDLSGCLRLIHEKGLLNQTIQDLLYARNTSSLQNIDIGIPYLRSSKELSQIKKYLESRVDGLSVWVEFMAAENFINLDKYLEVGFQGVILDLDQLQKNLIGFSEEERRFYISDIQTLLRFLEPHLKTLHQHQTPVLVKGNLSLQSDILEFLVAKGVYGLVVENPLEIQNLPETLRWIEKRLISKRLNPGV